MLPPVTIAHTNTSPTGRDSSSLNKPILNCRLASSTDGVPNYTPRSEPVLHTGPVYQKFGRPFQKLSFFEQKPGANMNETEKFVITINHKLI